MLKDIKILFIFSCLFPYITIFSTPFDTQPYPVILGIVIIFLEFLKDKDLKIPKIIGIYLLILFYALFIYLFSMNVMAGLRSLYSYISLFVVTLASYYSISFFKFKYLKGAVYTWFFFGTIQQFIMRNFGQIILPRLSTSFDRGVTGLSVEPSSYGIMVMFFLLLNDLFYEHNKSDKKDFLIVRILCIIQLLYARSALTFLLFFIYIAFTFIIKINFKKIITLLISSSIFLIVYELRDSIIISHSSRLSVLWYKLQGGIMNLILHDGSIADRLLHILIPLKSLFLSYGMGYGLGNWEEYSYQIIAKDNSLIRLLSQVNFTSGRIMSGWGSILFELGIVGILFLLVYLFIIHKLKKNKTYLINTLTLGILMAMSVSLAHPCFSLILAIYICAIRLSEEGLIDNLSENFPVYSYLDSKIELEK